MSKRTMTRNRRKGFFSYEKLFDKKCSIITNWRKRAINTVEEIADMVGEYVYIGNGNKYKVLSKPFRVDIGDDFSFLEIRVIPETVTGIVSEEDTISLDEHSIVNGNYDYKLLFRDEETAEAYMKAVKMYELDKVSRPFDDSDMVLFPSPYPVSKIDISSYPLYEDLFRIKLVS